MPAAKANNLPNSEVYPSNLVTVQSILRVAHSMHPTHPRISYLCVCGALEELRKIDPLSVLIPGVRPFKINLLYWIDENGDTDTYGDAKLGPSDVRYMQSFYLEYYQKNIKDLMNFLEAHRYFTGIGPAPMPLWPTPTEGVQASTTCCVRSDRCDLLINACPEALSLYKVLEHLSKDVQLPPQILEAHNEVKRLANIFVPYNIYPNDPYSDDRPGRNTPEMRAIEDLLGVTVFSRDANVRKIKILPNPREACPPKTQGHNKSENVIIGNTPMGEPSLVWISEWIEDMPLWFAILVALICLFCWVFSIICVLNDEK